MNIFYSPEVQQARHNHIPLVALESTVLSHGLPYPHNVELAKNMEDIIRAQGACPATIAICAGQICVGLTEDQIDNLAQNKNNHVLKLNMADIPFCLGQQKWGATTVAGTLFIAQMAGIRFFATGGLGGVHRDWSETLDISQDLPALSQNAVVTVCAGAKLILDLPKSLEVLESYGVPVIGWQTDQFPAFWVQKSGLPLMWSETDMDHLVEGLKSHFSMRSPCGVVVAQSVPAEQALDLPSLEKEIEKALQQAKTQSIAGKSVTPFLLARTFLKPWRPILPFLRTMPV
jgi:pseudouridylate synthase